MKHVFYFPNRRLSLAKGIKLIFFCFLIIPNYLFCQMDSLMAAFIQTEDINISKKLISEIINLCDFDVKCTKVLEAQIFQPPITDKKISNAFTFASQFANKGHYTPGQSFLMAGLKMAKKADPNHVMIGRFYNSIATGYSFEHKLDSALIFADLALQEFQKNEMQRFYWMPYNTKYLVYLNLKDYKRADENLAKAYELVEPGNRMDRGFLLHTLVTAKKNRGTKAEFEKYLDEFIKFKQAGPSQQKRDAEHMGLLSFFDTKEEATKVLEDRLKKLENIKELDPSLTRIVLAAKYKENKQYQKAIDLLEKSVSASGSLQNKNIYKQMYETYKLAGNHGEAYRTIERYIEINDSLYLYNLNKSIADNEIKFKTHEQEYEIELRDSKLKNARYQQNVILAVFLLFSLLGILAFYLFRKRKKYQSLLMEKEITIQKQKIDELNQLNKLLSLNAMIEGQEAERLRIAQDLHDSLGGMLTTVKAHFNAIQKEIDQISSLNVFAKTNELIDEACGEVRRIAHNMVPYSLKISGLNGALEDLKSNIIAKGLNCDLEIFKFEENSLSEEKKCMLYRIIQEITTNVIKHAEANHILIQLYTSESDLHLLVEDNGKGIDLNQLVSSKGIGIKSIESRVNYLGGIINYDSVQGKGTTVNVVVKI